MTVPALPLGAMADQAIAFLVTHYSDETRLWSRLLNEALRTFEQSLLWFPPWAFIVLLGVLAWFVTRRCRFVLVTVLGLGLLWNMGLWMVTISTLTLVFTASLLAVGLGVPTGIAAAVFPWLRRGIMPVLDIMQTMPAFVYLIPAIPFFGLGKVSAVMATLVFSVAPVIRLTVLGISQTPPDLVECANAFGSTRVQRLVKLELPLAAPSIVAGVNQTVMLALSMAVISAMIGAGGLGGEVWKAIQRLEIGRGIEAGLGIVIVAVILDGFFQSLSRMLTGRKA